MSQTFRGRATPALVTLMGGLLLISSSAFAHDKLEPEKQPLPGMLDRPRVEGAASRVPAPGESVIAYRLAWEPPDRQTLARRLAGALDTLLGPATPSGIVDPRALAVVAGGEEAGTWVRLAETPVLARYQPEVDELRLIHEDWDAQTEPESDIGVDGAREMAELYLSLLGERQVVDPRLFADAVMQLGFKVVGEGPTAERKADPGRVVEYRITLRPRLDGIELINAGARLGILASGQLASLRVGGVTPGGEWQGGRLIPDVAGAEREVRVGVDELRKRFAAEAARDARIDIAWERVAYVMPDEVKEAVVEPMWVVSYAAQTIVDGVPVVSRRKTLAYSLTEPGAAPIDLTAPAPRHEEVRVTRRQ
jgi:hypothetical protein